MRWDISFNTTLVTVYRKMYQKYLEVYHVSIQPLLLFIYRFDIPGLLVLLVSIQPLLLFINRKHVCNLRIFSFQYNPCYCLSTKPSDLSPDYSEFQYNPCYCLSVHKTVTRRVIRRFNTTLVTVYRFPPICLRFGGRSFNTTLVTVYLCQAFLIKNIARFQYNPCYCLSQSRLSSQTSIRRFNTTLVTVYLTLPGKMQKRLWCFNTTLVTVYR